MLLNWSLRQSTLLTPWLRHVILWLHYSAQDINLRRVVTIGNTVITA